MSSIEGAAADRRLEREAALARRAAQWRQTLTNWAPWLLIGGFALWAALARTDQFVVGIIVGYFAHGWISFAGHGDRDDHAAIGTRFVTVNLVGYFLNSFWVWLLVERLAGPTWWPILPNVALTPLMTFWLHRYWTFR